MPRAQKPCTVARHMSALLSRMLANDFSSTSEDNAVRAAIAMISDLYAKDPKPFKWAKLPEAFIGECGCYYPARLSEARSLTAAGLIQETDYVLDHVPIFEPTDGVAPSRAERALRALRK
jgi:hypothetical protein